MTELLRIQELERWRIMATAETAAFKVQVTNAAEDIKELKTTMRLVAGGVWALVIATVPLLYANVF